MNQLERVWLNQFVAKYQRITMQIERHDTYLDELIAEENRIRMELEQLEWQKERTLRTFADVMLCEASKFPPQKNDQKGVIDYENNPAGTQKTC